MKIESELRDVDIQKFYKIGKANKFMETQEVSPQQMLSMIVELKARVDKLQEEFDDTVLTDEEIKLVDESLVHEKEGKLISSDDLKRELGI